MVQQRKEWEGPLNTEAGVSTTSSLSLSASSASLPSKELRASGGEGEVATKSILALSEKLKTIVKKAEDERELLTNEIANLQGLFSS